MNKEKQIALFSVICILAVSFVATSFLIHNKQIITEQETRIEQLQQSNAVLQQERDELYTEYVSVRDELWNLKNGMANN